MTCQEVVQGLSDYIHRRDARTRASVEEHIAACHDCHVVLDSTQCTILLYRASRATALSGEKRRLLLGKLDAACRGCGGSKDPAR